MAVEEQAGRALTIGPEFHWNWGLHFARVNEPGHEMDKAVRLRYERKEHVAPSEAMPGGEHEVGSEFFIPASEWASIIAAVTPEGDNATTYRIALGFHGA